MSRTAVCGPCAALTHGRLCRTCGAMTTTATAAFLAWESASAARRLRAWRDEGRLDDAKLDELIATIPLPSPQDSHPLERRADALVAESRAFLAGARDRARRTASHGDEAQVAAAAVFGPSPIAAAGLDALAQLDDVPEHEPDRGPAPRLGALHAFWLVGALLVLAGSLMGVREAWRSFEGVARPSVTAGAVFAYHLGFAALARFLAPRSATTGRVLGTIAVGLLPIAFVAAAVAIALSPIGIVCACLLLAASTLSLRALDRVLGATSLAVAPSLAFMAAIGAFPATRGVLAIAGLLPLALVVSKRRRDATIGIALYGAVVVALFAWFGPPGEPVLAPTSFGEPFLVAILWTALASALASAATASRAIRALSLGALVSCFVTALTAVIAVRYSELLATGLLAYVPAAVGLLAAATLVLEKRSTHLAIPIAMAAVGLGAVVATDEPAYWFAALAIVPFAVLLVPTSWRRLTAWSYVGSLTTIPLWLNAHDHLTAIVAAALAVAAHVGARGRASRHWLGAGLAFIAVAVASGHPILALVAIAVAYRLAKQPDISLAAAGAVVVLDVAHVAFWIHHPTDVSPLLGLGAVIAGVVAVFLAPLLPRARGHVVTLTVAAGLVALAALVQHVVHPLPPTATGLQLVVVLAGLWLAARGLDAKGPALASRLGRAGQRYDLVARAAIFGVALVLFAGAFRLDNDVLSLPPILLAGGGLGFLLLERRPLYDLGVTALALAATAFGAQALGSPFLGAAMFCTLAAAIWVPLRSTHHPLRRVLVYPTACAAPLVVHALALPTVAHALLAVAIVLLGIRRGARGRTQLVGLAYAVIALFTPTPLVLLVLAIASAIAAWSWRGILGNVLSVVPPLVLGVAFFAHHDHAISLVLAAAVAHVASLFAPADARSGTRIGRDVLLVATAALVAAEPSLFAAVLALAIGLHAIAAQRTVRHVYFVELMVVGLYATVTQGLALSPTLDAMLGLAYGFTLLGIATLTRRLGLDAVATATRRFLAVLPVLVGLLTLHAAPDETTALFALVASILYATAAFTNESRAFASFAAVAANAALVAFALAQGLDGIEIWLAPLGLLVAIMAQIFAPSLSPSARRTIRIAGGVLLYLPAGLKLALRLGAAEDPTYAIVFGAVCLAGVGIGALLRIRAYLALATLSLVLDLVANLVHAGLRDHRLGFVLLSTTGLAILGAMIFVTLRRDAVRRALAVIRLPGWE